MTHFSIPEAVLKQHIAILGKTGSGKTSTEKLAVEQVVESGARVCVLDTVKSDWWGITSSASGKRAGLPFKILGGPRGHVPLHANAGKVIGQLVAGGKLPLSIIDMADFEAGGVQRFFVDFAQALFRHMRGVVYLVIEESHEVAPKERAGFGAENLSIHWAKKLATSGRSKGIRLIVATQRVQSLHNAVLGSCETVIAHRLTTPADQEPVLKWMKANVAKDTQVKVAESLSSLPTGTGWLCSGEAKIFERLKFPKFKTYDNSATPTGDEADVDVTTAAVDQDELRAIIGDAVKEAEATDPKALRAQVARLAAELQKTTQNITQNITAPDKDALSAAERKGFAQAERKLAGIMRRELSRKLKEGLATMRRHAAEAVDRIDEELRGIDAKDAELVIAFEPPAAKAAPSRAPTRANGPAISPARTPVARAASRRHEADGQDRPLGAERKPLAALAAVSPAGMTEGQWRVAAGFKNSGTWSTYRGRLSGAGRIEERGGVWFATEQGIADIGDRMPTMPPPGKELVEFWTSRISGAGKILRYLAEIYPAAIDRDQLATELGHTLTSGTFSTYLGRLRTPGLIEVGRDKMVRASPMLMEGAPL
jgi:hypothetical protein